MAVLDAKLSDDNIQKFEDKELQKAQKEHLNQNLTQILNMILMVIQKNQNVNLLFHHIY